MKNVINGLEQSIAYWEKDIEDYRTNIRSFEEKIKETKETISKAVITLNGLTKAVEVLKRELGEEKP